MPGAAGNAMLFFGFMIGAIVLGLYAGSYAAHIFLACIDATNGGAEDVAWPDEPYVDWVWKFVYLVWLVAIWLMPLMFIARWLANRDVGGVLPIFAVAAAGLFWLLFPISMMSSMSASSRWIIFTPAVLPRFAQRSGSLINFYIATAPVLIAAAGGVILLVGYGSMVFVPLAAAALGAVLLIYARLFGRLAVMLRYTRDWSPAEAPRSPPRRRRPRRPVHDPWGAPEGIVQPRDLPHLNTPDPIARFGYDVQLGDQSVPVVPAPVRALRRPPAAEEGQYDLQDGPAAVAPVRPPIPSNIAEPSEYEMALASIGKNDPGPPAFPWTSNTFTFPLRPSNLGPMTWLTVSMGGVGFFVRMAIMFVP